MAQVSTASGSVVICFQISIFEPLGTMLFNCSVDLCCCDLLSN
ncbi:hypothetical protein BOVAC1_5260 [Bacteroides ovatus]|nr:hypothetical protein BOVAC1_5260 [Bacteroides ovatus]